MNPTKIRTTVEEIRRVQAKARRNYEINKVAKELRKAPLNERVVVKIIRQDSSEKVFEVVNV